MIKANNKVAGIIKRLPQHIIQDDTFINTREHIHQFRAFVRRRYKQLLEASPLHQQHQRDEFSPSGLEVRAVDRLLRD